MPIGVGIGNSDVVALKNMEGYLDGMSVQQQSLTLVVDTTKVYLDVEAVGGGDIDYYIDGVLYTLDCTTGSGVDGKARVELPQGTATIPVKSIVYVAEDENGGSTNIALYTTVELPKGAFAPVAVMTIQDYATVATDGALLFQRTTEAIDHNGKGAISYMREKLRFIKSEYAGGVDQHVDIVTNALSEDNVNFETTNGVVFQLHRQNFPDYKTVDSGIWVANASGAGLLTAYQKVLDLNTLKETSDGTALVDGDSINVVIWGSINYSGSDCKLFVNLPTGKYTVDSDAVADVNDTCVKKIPANFKTTGFLIARLVLKYNTVDSGTWTNLLTAPVEVWYSETADISSPNYPSNYGNNEDETLVLQHIGANSVRVHFDAFDTEANFDFVRLYDGSDVLQYTYDGNLGAFTSPEITGDTVKVRFTSDGSVTRTGYHIDTLEWADTVASGAEVDDLRGNTAIYDYSN